MLEEKKKILNENEFLNERKNAKIISKFYKAKRLYLLLSVFLCLVLIGIVYFLTDYSNIFRISVDGNVYLKDEDIIELSGLSTSSKYLLTRKKSVENKIKNNNFIEDCDVELIDDRVVKITVKEKKAIGYTLENGENVLVLADDSRLNLNKDNIYLIEKVPLLEGFSKDQIILIGKNFVDVDYKMINEISEIHYYPSLKFQDHELIMRDGNYIFTSVYGINRINRYYDIVSSYSSKDNNCYYIEDISGNAYISACPWQSQDDNKEAND